MTETMEGRGLARHHLNHHTWGEGGQCVGGGGHSEAVPMVILEGKP